MKTNKNKIKSLVKDMLKQSYEEMIKDIDKVLESGAIDVVGWDESHNPMILPKCIVTAILQKESKQYEGKGTTFQKQIKKQVEHISYFL